MFFQDVAIFICVPMYTYVVFMQLHMYIDLSVVQSQLRGINGVSALLGDVKAYSVLTGPCTAQWSKIVLYYG